MFIIRKKMEISLIVFGAILFCISFVLKGEINFSWVETIRWTSMFVVGFFVCQLLWKRELDKIAAYTKIIEEKQYEKGLDQVKGSNYMQGICKVSIDLFKESKKGFQGTLKTSVELAHAMDGLNNIVLDMEAATEQIATTTDNLAQGSTEQLDALNNMLENFREVGNYLDDIKSFSESSVKEAEECYESAKNGKIYIEETGNTIDKIHDFSKDLREVVLEFGEKVEKINTFVTTITSIANHTKLLALNSSIEAARAGEQGKGFAVVAKEVGALAYESQHATSDISKILQELTSKLEELKEYAEENVTEVAGGKTKVEKTNEAFHVIESNTQETKDSIVKIRDYLKEIQGKNTNIFKAADNIQMVSETNAANSQELNATLEEMSASFKKIASNTEGVTELSKELQESVASSAMESYMYNKALNILKQIKDNTEINTKLRNLAKEYYISDIYMVEANGEIVYSTEKEAIGLNSFEIDEISKQASKTKEKYLATPIRRRVEDNEMYKFLHVPYDNGRVLTVSLSLDLLLSL